MSKKPIKQSGAPAVVLQRMVSRRPDAKMDEDGHCTVCGCEVREYESADTDAEAMRRHRCPKGFSVCGERYRVLIDGWKWSGTRHCTKPKGHKGKCGKAANAPGERRAELPRT